MTPFMASVSWIDRKGAGRTRTFSDCGELSKFLASLRREATIRNWQGEKIGAVEFAPDVFDDNRRKWIWCFDSEGASMPVEQIA